MFRHKGKINIKHSQPENEKCLENEGNMYAWTQCT